MGWTKLGKMFAFAVASKTARGSVLMEMVAGERKFDAKILRQYVEKGFSEGHCVVAEMAIRHNLPDVAIKLLESGAVDLNRENRVNVIGTPRLYGGHVFSRLLTDGERLLKASMETGNVDLIRRLHQSGVPADIETCESGGTRHLYVFRDLWKSGACDHLGVIIPIMAELYPAETEKFLETEAAYSKRKPNTIKADVFSVSGPPSSLHLGTHRRLESGQDAGRALNPSALSSPKV